MWSCVPCYGLKQHFTYSRLTYLFKVNVDEQPYGREGESAGEVAPGEGALGTSTLPAKLRKSETSAELDFEEFVEIVARICDLKVPEPRDCPFEQTLDNYLGLLFLPAAKNAAKARIKRSGG